MIAITQYIQERAKAYAVFILALIIITFLSGMLSVFISGARETAGIGFLIGPSIAHIGYAVKYLPWRYYYSAILGAVISVATLYLTLFLIRVVNFHVFNDLYGIWDYLFLYIVISIVLWELVYFAIHKWNTTK